MIQKYKTNLNCGSCVAAVTPFLNSEKSIQRWSVDTLDSRKTLTIEGPGVSPETVERLVEQAGFRVLGSLDASMAVAAPEAVEQRSFLQTYRPLLLVFAYVLGLVALGEAIAGSFDGMRSMRHFMGGFFVAFSFFKLLDLAGFADAFQSYDVVARRSWAYGYAYPFIELGLGIAYLLNFLPVVTNVLTLLVMLLGLIGVALALSQKRQIKCACLGTVFNLPMSKVTLIEDGSMAIMAAVMLGVFLLG